jgi:hypothetical protein
MKKIISICFVIFSIGILQATHNRSGEILYKRIAPFTQVVGTTTTQVYTYSITVIKYTDDGPGIADRCGDTIYFGDGAKERAPRINGPGTCGCGTINNMSVGCGEIIVNSGSYKVKKNIYSTIHTYPGPGVYNIRSIDPNRNQGVVNIPNSVNIPFYIESQIVLNSFLGENSSPILSNPPTDQGEVGTCLYLNCCAYDEDGDSLSYEISTCRGRDGNMVAGYSLPDAGANGTFSIDATTGLLTWCTPRLVGEYNIAVKVNEWRKTSCTGQYQLIGYVLRDLQIIINSSVASPAQAQQISNACVSAGSNLSKQIQFVGQSSTIKLYGETPSFNSDPAAINPVSVTGTQVVTYAWLTKCSQVRKTPYEVYLVSSVNGLSGARNYQQFQVTVLPPAPTVFAPTIDTGKVILNWSSLQVCLPSLTGYNIYRKTGQNNWNPSACEQGVPTSSGFQLIASTPPTAITFTDDVSSGVISNGTDAHYIVTAVTSDCLESHANTTVTLSLIVGIKEKFSDQNFSIHPNPFNENVILDFGTNKYQNVEISVFGSDGRLILNTQKRKIDGEINLSLTDLKLGVYLVRVTTEDGVSYKKLIKE